MEDNLPWKTPFNGNQLIIEEKDWRKKPFYERRKKTYDVRQSLMTYDRRGPTGEENIWGETPIAEDNLWWMTTFNERQPLLEYNLQLKAIFNRWQHVMEDTFDKRIASIKEDLWWKRTVDAKLPLTRSFNCIWPNTKKEDVATFETTVS